MTLKATLAGITIFVIAAAASVYPEAVTKLYLPQGGSNCRDGSRLLVYGFEFMNRITAVDVSPAAATVFANADQSEVWVFSPCDTHVDIINTVTDRLKRRIDVGLIASDAAFSADGKYCFMTGHTGDYHTTESNIIVVDCETYDVTDTIEAARDPVSVVVTSDAKYLYYPSRSGGSVGKIAIPEFEEIAIIPVGFEPVDLALTADGNYLFVACRGLDSGTRGGTQVSVIDARTDQLCWIFNDLGGSPISLTITPGSAAMIICFADPLPETGENVVLFDLDISADLISLARRTGWSLGRSPTAGFIAPGGDYWFGCDPEGGGLIGIDLTADTAVHLLSGTDKQYPAQVAAVTIDIDESLAILEAEIAAATDSTTLPNSYLDIAYLLQMVGRENDMVAACQRIVDDFPTSFAAVTAQLRLADICYKDRLFSQCANYTRTALHQYRDLLQGSDLTQLLPSSVLLIAVERLALLAKRFDKDYLKVLADVYLQLSVHRPEMVEFYYQLGLMLRHQDQKKLTRRCFNEARNQLVKLGDGELRRLMEARLQLALDESSTLYEIKWRKEKFVIDGLLSEWERFKPLAFTTDRQLSYGDDLWLGIHDLSGKIYLARTNSDLYIAGVITDDVLLRPDGDGGDFVGIYFDLRPTAAAFHTRQSEAGDGCFLLRVCSPDAETPKASLELNVSTAYQISSMRTEHGYTFEMKLPLSLFGAYLPEKKKRFGLGVQLVDFDTGGDIERVKAMGFLLPATRGDDKLQPQLFGFGRF